MTAPRLTAAQRKFIHAAATPEGVLAGSKSPSARKLLAHGLIEPVLGFQFRWSITQAGRDFLVETAAKMAKLTVAETAAIVMREQNVRSVMWGDEVLTTIYARYGRSAHPHKAMACVLACLETSDLFTRGVINGSECTGPDRRVRIFTLAKP